MPDLFMKVAMIKKEVANKWGFSVPDLEGVNRSKMLTYARHEAMFRVRNETPLSYPEIGFFFGRRDHTSIIYAVKNFGKKQKLIERKRPKYGNT